MPKRPPVHELKFLKIASNHALLTSNLTSLQIAASDIREYASHVCGCWFKLAEEHLADAKKAIPSRSGRTAFSRAYYAAYNASKAVRYFTSGSVSLTGDDHKKAGLDLPEDEAYPVDSGSSFRLLTSAGQPQALTGSE